MVKREFITRKEASTYLIQKGLRVSVRSLENFAVRNSGLRGPKFFKLDHNCYYRIEDLDEWMKKRMRRVE
jgi:hypothetical protein